MVDRPKIPLSAIMASAPPTEEEMQASARARYDHIGFTYLDQWSPELHALSIPSKAIPLSETEHWDLINIHDGGGITPALRALANRLDDAMDWRNHFVRLNSRSPKDSAWPALPITCAGRQALDWIMGSERTFDDLCLMRRIAPAFIYLRKLVYIPKAWEVRCFIKDGRMIAATQYYKDEENERWADPVAREACWAGLQAYYFDTVKLTVPRDTFVLDVIPGEDGWQVLEINPYGMSDPILFGNYAAVEDEGGFRVVDTPPRPNSDGVGEAGETEGAGRNG